MRTGFPEGAEWRAGGTRQLGAVRAGARLCCVAAGRPRAESEGTGREQRAGQQAPGDVGSFPEIRDVLVCGDNQAAQELFVAL